VDGEMDFASTAHKSTVDSVKDQGDVGFVF
jgi:hypothetical protein